MGLKEHKRKVERLNIKKIYLDAVEDSKEIAMDLNTDDQLFAKGIDSTGSRLAPYAPGYAALKRTLNPNGVTDLKLSGDFHSGWFINSNLNKIVFGSRDSKSSMLSRKYGADIFGLTPPNQYDWARGEILPRIQDDQKKALNR